MFLFLVLHCLLEGLGAIGEGTTEADPTRTRAEADPTEAEADANPQTCNELGFPS